MILDNCEALLELCEQSLKENLDFDKEFGDVKTK